MTPADHSQPEPDLDSDGFSTDIEREDLGGERAGKPFDPELVDVRTRHLSVTEMLSQIERGMIGLAPGFRRGGVWTDVRQSRLIESMLLRIPIGGIFAAEDKSDDWIVVDGVQRLVAIARFIDADLAGGSVLRLSGLEYIDFDGASYEDLSIQLRRRLDETELTFHLIGRNAAHREKINIISRVSAGREPMTAQELRHAMIPGPARDLLKELAESPEFLEATGRSARDLRMSDREMVLRFVAFHWTDPAEYDHGDLEDFLRTVMEYLNGRDREEADLLRRDFVRAMRAASDIFGAYAFRKITGDRPRRGRINKALFEAVAVNLARRGDDEVRRLANDRLRVRARLADLLEHVDFSDAITGTTGIPAKVRTRFGYIDKLFHEVTDA